jgi:hyperosmotically inducible protein
MKTFAIAAATATALTLTMAGAAFAQTQTTQSPMVVAAGEMTEAKEDVSDAWITTKVKTELMAKKDVPGVGVDVDTKDGVVSLTSTDPLTQSEKDKAIAIAKSVKGVKSVMADGLKTK